MIPLFCLCAPLAADLLTGVGGNPQLINAKENVQLSYNQRIERVHDACGMGQEGEGSGRRAEEGSGVMVVILP